MLSGHHPRRHIKSFHYAFEGIEYVIKTQANFRVHIIIAMIVCIMAYLLDFSLVEWSVLMLTITFILCLEMVNTVFEVVVDHLWQEEHPKAKIIKDVAAGIVLVGASGAALIGILLFIPHLVLMIVG